MRRRLFVTLCFLAILSGCSSRSTRLENLIQRIPEGYVIKGKGSPTVVFEANLGDGYEIWGSILDNIARVSKIYAYSRNFEQKSSSSSSFVTSRNSTQIAEELRNKLKALDLEPPYILVGHAYGGLYVLKFAELYPKEVAGIILVDGRPKEFTAQCEQLKLQQCKIPFLVQSFRAPNEQKEIRGLAESESSTPGPEKLGKIPITVIASTVPSKNQTLTYQETWVRAQERFARALQNGKFVTALGSKHYIHRDRPELIIQEIRKMIVKVK